MRKLFNSGLVVLLTTTPFFVNAEGLERFNIDPGFLFSEGSAASVGFASVNPSFGATSGNAGITLQSGLEVAPDFSALNLSVKTSISEKIDFGLFYSDNGNGVLIDWGTISGAGTEANVTIAADLEIPTLAALGKYKVTDNISVFGGLKRSTVADGSFAKVARDSNGNNLVDQTAHWVLSKTSEMGMVYGAGYEMPEIALRVSLMIEDDIDLSIPRQ